MLTLPRWRLHLLRFLYALVAFGLFAVIWPEVVTLDPALSLQRGTVLSFLVALSLLCLAGLWRPVQLLPVLVFEFLWKLVWVVAIWWRLWHGQQVDTSIEQTFYSVAIGGALVGLGLPWPYLLRVYLGRTKQQSD